MKHYWIANPYEDPYLNEGRGIPNVLKRVLEDVFNDLDLTSQNTFDIDEFEFKINGLIISYINTKNKTIYARVKSGKPSMEKELILNNPIIDVYLDFEKYDLSDLKRVVLHELLHIYEIYNRIKGKTKKDLDWFNSNKLIEIRNKYKNDKFLDSFIYVLYLTFSNEINARVAETYSVLIDERSEDYTHVKTTLSKSNAWQKMLEIKNFNFDNYKINKPLCITFFKEYNSLIRPRLKQKFKIFDIPESERDIDFILKNYKYLFDKKVKYFENKLLKLIPEVIEDAKRLNSV